MITVDLSHSSVNLQEIETELKNANDKLINKTGLGNDFLGWVDLPEKYDRDEFQRIKEKAKYIQDNAEVLVVIGIGGSYLGAKAVIDVIKGQNYNLTKKKTPDVFFAGNGLNANYIKTLMDIIGDRVFAINFISKSGTTTEPAVSFRFFKEKLEKRVGAERAKKLIVATTDKAVGKLKELSNTEGYTTFVVPDDIGGRYSVLSAVGLFPAAVAGLDIDELMKGAAEERAELCKYSLENAAWKYAGARNLLLRANKTVEILGCYDPNFRFFSEWWKQLYGESEGKDGKGLFPASVEFSADLHSMGQYIQQGPRFIFESIVRFDDGKNELVLPSEPNDIDGLKYLEGKTVEYIGEQAFKGVLAAHTEGNVPNIIINAPEINERTIGQLIYFFEYSCGLSGYLLGVNPFDQPGVEFYKKNMFRLLGKPGY